MPIEIQQQQQNNNTKQIGNYTPGVVTDLIREVRDASRVRDESLLNRVKALIDEKSWSLNEANLRVLRELEEIKVSAIENCRAK